MHRQKKILLVDDDRDLLDTVKELLEQEGYEAIEVMDCNSAKLALKKERPGLVLLDLSLPDGNSFEICKLASEGFEDLSPTPVFILSGKCSVESKIKGFMSGAKRYFTKPFDVEELLEAVSGIFLHGNLSHSTSA